MDLVDAGVYILLREYVALPGDCAVCVQYEEALFLGVLDDVPFDEKLLDTCPVAVPACRSR